MNASLDKARALAEGLLRRVRATVTLDAALGLMVQAIRQRGGSPSADSLETALPVGRPMLDALLAVGELLGVFHCRDGVVRVGPAPVTPDVTGNSARATPDAKPTEEQEQADREMEEWLEVHFYGRVSTPEQAEKGYSLAVQRNRLHADAPRYGFRIVGESQDVARGSTMNRPGLMEALAAIGNRRASVLAVTKVDRLTRSTRDLCDIVERVHSADGFLFALEDGADSRSPEGRLRLRQLAALAEHESERIAARVTATASFKREQGMTTNGAAPFGFELDGERLVEKAVEQETVRRARELRSDGLSLRRVSRELATMGLLSRRGRPFEAMQIARMVAH